MTDKYAFIVIAYILFCSHASKSIILCTHMLTNIHDIRTTTKHGMCQIHNKTFIGILIIVLIRYTNTICEMRWYSLKNCWLSRVLIFCIIASGADIICIGVPHEMKEIYGSNELRFTIKCNTNINIGVYGDDVRWWWTNDMLSSWITMVWLSERTQTNSLKIKCLN